VKSKGNPTAKRKAKPLVMVVDDEPIIADTLVEILKDEGFDAFPMSDGAAAIVWARRMLPNIIVSDVMMPGLNGIEMAKQIREFLPSSRIVLFSGQAATADLLRDARAEGHKFEVLAKPIKPDQLISTLQRPMK